MPTRKLVTRYEEDLRLFPDRWHKIGLVLWTVVLVIYPVLASARWLSVANLTLVTVVGGVSLMILSGFTGQISVGHAAFLALGAYTAAVASSGWGVPFWAALPAAGVVAAAVGLIAGPFALRLRGLYLAIITIGLVFVVNHVLLSLPGLTGGVSGIAVPMHLWFAPDAPDSLLTPFSNTWSIGPIVLTFERKLYVLYVLLAGGVVWIGSNLSRSHTGRAMKAVRDHDLAASVLAVNPAKSKIIAFGVSSFLGGVAGAMFGFQQQFITVDPPFNINMSVEYIAIIVIGGLGTIFGAVAGAMAFVVIGPMAEVVTEQIPLLRELSSAQQSVLVLAAVVMAFMAFESAGLHGIWVRVKRYFAAWPFRY